MATERKAPPSSPPPAGAPKRAAPSSPPPARTFSNPEMRKAVSAARAQPLPEDRPKLTKQALRAQAENTALNVFGVLRDTWDDFRSSDRFFKYKAGVLAGWVLISVMTFVVACPGGNGPTNSLGARLLVNPPTVPSDPPLYSVLNESKDAWTNVKITVNGQYVHTAAQVPGYLPEPLSTLVGPDGKTAPRGMPFRSVELESDQGHTVLMKDGEVR